jgi:hypothetical protein
MWDLAAAPCILIAPFVAFVRSNDYPLLAPEILVCLTVLAALGLACGLAAIAGGTAVRVPLMAVLLTYFIDVQFDVIAGWRAPLAIVVAAALGVSWLLRGHVAKIAVAVFGTVIGTTLVLPAPSPWGTSPLLSQKPPRQDLPLVVHLVLDEHIGIGGIPADLDDGGRTRTFLREFYRHYGFRTFDRAYSRYHDTLASLSNLLNLTASPLGSAHFARRFHQGMPMKDNLVFRQMVTRGYRLRVHQSDYVDLCTTDSGFRADACFTYPLERLGALDRPDLPVGQRLRFIQGMFARLSFLHRRARQRYNRAVLAMTSAGWSWVPPPWPVPLARVSALSAMTALEAVIDDVTAAGPGTMIFALIMLPHHPYAHGEQCTLRPDPATWLSASSPTASPYRNTIESRARRYRPYLAQLICVHAKLAVLFERMRGSGTFDDAIIIVHGDHGSRLEIVPPKAPLRERMSPADYVDSFSTLFAVKSPAHPPGSDPRLLPLDLLLASVVEGRALPPDEHSTPVPPVFLSGGPGRRLVPLPMVSFGDGAAEHDGAATLTNERLFK